VESAQNAPSIEQADQIVRQVEEQHDLLSHQVGGWCAWPLVRFQQALRLTHLPWASESLSNTYSMAEKARQLPAFLSALRSLEARPLLVQVKSTNRAEQAGDLFQDFYFDDLLQRRQDFYKLEQVNNKAYLERSRQALVPSHLDSAALEVLGAALGRALPDQVRRAAATLAAAVKAGFGAEALPAAAVRRYLQRFYGQKRVYARLLRRLGTRTLLHTVSYSNHALIAAALENGLRVVELQHGIIYRNHPGYSWSEYARQYKAQMPLPHQILLYGDFWQQELIAGGFWDSAELPITGSLRIDRYRQLSPDRDPHRLHVLVTTQELDLDRLLAFLASFMKAVNVEKPCRLTIKLHPREKDRQLYKAAFTGQENVRVLLGSESPSTFELLQQANFHASISSTCHYEALGLGVPTLILPLASCEKVAHLLDSGYAYLPDTPQAMAEIVLARQGLRVPPETSAHFFKSGAVKNMQKIIDDSLQLGKAGSP
jgi:hypothetical protein